MSEALTEVRLTQAGCVGSHKPCVDDYVSSGSFNNTTFDFNNVFVNVKINIT